MGIGKNTERGVGSKGWIKGRWGFRSSAKREGAMERREEEREKQISRRIG